MSEQKTAAKKKPTAKKKTAAKKKAAAKPHIPAFVTAEVSPNAIPRGFKVGGQYAMTPISPWMSWVQGQVERLGGYCDRHFHACRGWTLAPRAMKHKSTTPLEAAGWPLQAKQEGTQALHQGKAYYQEELYARGQALIEYKIACGFTRLHSLVDVSEDIGLKAWEVWQQLRSDMNGDGRVSMLIGPQPIASIDTRANWALFRRAMKTADFSVGLPERSAVNNWKDPKGRIGFKLHCFKVVREALRRGGDCQVHTDQMDLMEERGTLDLIEAIELLEPPEITALQKGKPGTGEPILWAVHVISPSGYSEKEFKKLIDKLLDFNIGIIWCPSAGISMRRIRPQNGPLHNAAPRVLDFLLAGVWVVLGTDNNDDMMVPAGCGNPIIEIVMAANIARFYVPHIWAKLGAGIKLNAIDRNVLEAAIRRDHEAFQMYDPSWQPAIAV